MRVNALLGALGLALIGVLVGCTIVESKDEPDGGAGEGGEAGEGGAGAGGVAGTGTGGVAGKGGTAGTAGVAGNAGTGGTVEEEAFPPRAGGLEPAADCTGLETMIKENAKARNNADIDARIAAIKCIYNVDGGTGGAGGQGGAAGSGGDWSGAGTIDYSKTNLQKEGVDEADIVKTDGQYIYLLHGDRFHVVTATPPENLAVGQGVQIEGWAREMFVEGGRAVVYSQVDSGALHKAAGVTPKPTTYPDYYYYSNPPPPNPNMFPSGSVATKVTVIDLAGTPPAPTVVSQKYFEGQYLSSRRVENSVRTVITGAAHGPPLKKDADYYDDDPQKMIDELEKIRKENNDKIDASTVKDYLPYRFDRNGSTVTATEAPCSEYMIPKAGSTDYGLTQIQSFDWTAPADMKGISLPVTTQVVHGGPQSIYIAATGSGDAYFTYSCQPSTPPKAGQVLYYEYTYIHEFDYKNNAIIPEYIGTGTIPGTVLNQFSVDEYAEHFRVATTSDMIRYVDIGGGQVEEEFERSSHVFTMETKDGKELAILGRVDGLGKTEKIYATRFIEDRAYVVTFLQKDPLIVVDLADPAAPKVLGEVVIPGFGEYVHPIDKTHLMTIGKETVDDQSTEVIGLSLQLFDVSDPTKPKLQQKFVFEGESWGYSEAEYNHRAFNYNPDKGIVVFPYVVDGSEIHSWLEVFKVDVAGGADKSFVKLGAISHDDLFNSYWWEYCYEVVGTGVRRGLFIGDNIYSISFGGIKVHGTADLTKEIKSLSFQSPSGLGVQCAMP